MVAFIEQNGQPIHDAHWISKMFMVSHKQIEERYKFALYTTTAHNKFTDTRIGGNWAINMPPAYTRFADPRQSGLNQSNVSGTAPRGMGAYYSEQIDDPSHLAHACYGVAQFKGSLSFFNGMGSLEAALYARLGRVPLAFLVGKTIGVFTSMRFLPFILVGTAIKYILGRGSSKYYSFRPTMHAYWKRVDFICNSIAVNIGLYQKPDSLASWGNRIEERNMYDDNFVTDDVYKQLVKSAHDAAGDLFKPDGGIDVYMMANRAQRLASARRKVLEGYGNSVSNQEDAYKMMLNYEFKTRYTDDPSKASLNSLLQIHAKSDYANTTFNEDNAFDSEVKNQIDNGGYEDVETAQETSPTSATTNADGTTTSTSTPPPAVQQPSMYNYYEKDPTNDQQVVMKPGWFNRVWEDMKDDYNGAFQWVTYRVHNTGSISSSFSNQSKTAEIDTMINGISAKLSNARYTFSGGNTGIGIIDSTVGAIKSGVEGYLAGLDASGIINLAGSAYVDVPEHWESSSSNMPSESYKMELRTPFANKLSRFMDLYVPLAMQLAASLPISTGRQQYTSPFMCQIYSPGRMSTKLGMYESLNVDIGVGNIGFNLENQPLGFDVSWSVKDMNKTLHAPIDTGASLLNPLRSIFDDDNAFNDYLNVISGLSMADQIIPTRKLSRNLALRLNQWDSFWSVGNWTMGFMDSSLGRGVKSLVTLGGVAGIPGMSVPQIDRSLAR